MKALFAAALAAAVSGNAEAASRSDLRDYAIAACLIRQAASAELRSEGYRLADVVINRAGVSPFTWKALANAVDATLARRGLLMVHVDAPVAQSTQPAPLATCLLVIDDPAPRKVMAKLEHEGR